MSKFFVILYNVFNYILHIFVKVFYIKIIMNLRIKETAKRKGFSLDDTAKKIGITYTSFYRRINNPKLSTLEEIASALNCEIAELLPVGESFYHSYDENGNWQGIRKK